MEASFRRRRLYEIGAGPSPGVVGITLLLVLVACSWSGVSGFRVATLGSLLHRPIPRSIGAYSRNVHDKEWRKGNSRLSAFSSDDDDDDDDDFDFNAAFRARKDSIGATTGNRSVSSPPPAKKKFAPPPPPPPRAAIDGEGPPTTANLPAQILFLLLVLGIIGFNVGIALEPFSGPSSSDEAVVVDGPPRPKRTERPTSTRVDFNELLREP